MTSRRPRIAFVCDQSLKESLERWAEEESRTLSNLVELICKNAVENKEKKDKSA
ncbi:ribbon-helix-helix domain-containing protein [Nostoc cycadae]|uniref:ribbon-helix-helix domain-containing protein n=1 Tax=Nostoc cycadae TaxID=246795 RepID=UPI000CCC2C7E|nr:hypothetical protein [Nostoc cycadae]